MGLNFGVSMAGKKSTPDQVIQVVTLREAGYTTAMIASKTGLSSSTVKRLCSSNKVRKGAISEELVDLARADVLSSISSNDELKAMTENMIADNLAISSLIRDKVLESVEKLTPTDIESATLCLRGLTAASTSLKNTTDSIRSLFSFDHIQGDVDGLEDLVFYDLTEEDIKDMRRQQDSEYKILQGISDDGGEVISVLPVIDEEDNEVVDEVA